MKLWLFLFTTNILFGQTPAYLGIRSGYFMTAGIQIEKQPFSIAIGYRLPGGWLSLGNNTRIGGLTTYEIPLLKVSDSNNYLSLGIKSGIYAAEANYTHSMGRLEGMHFWSTGLTSGLSINLQWRLIVFKADVLPGFDLSNNYEWRNRFFFWRCTGASVMLQLY
jgi:hypothetical protein